MTNLPNQIFQTANFKQAIIIDINPESNIFSKTIADEEKGFSLRGNSGEILPLLVQEIKKIK